MTRGAFNTTCDLYEGPGGASPGAFVGTCDCRLVFEDAIFMVGTDSPAAAHYFTLADFVPVGAWDAPFYAVDSDLAYRVAIPSGSPPQWWVLWTHSILWQTQPLYYRGTLEFLPAPHLDAILMESGSLILKEDTSYILLE